MQITSSAGTIGRSIAIGALQSAGLAAAVFLGWVGAQPWLAVAVLLGFGAAGWWALDTLRAPGGAPPAATIVLELLAAPPRPVAVRPDSLPVRPGRIPIAVLLDWLSATPAVARVDVVDEPLPTPDARAIGPLAEAYAELTAPLGLVARRRTTLVLTAPRPRIGGPADPSGTDRDLQVAARRLAARLLLAGCATRVGTVPAPTGHPATATPPAAGPVVHSLSRARGRVHLRGTGAAGTTRTPGGRRAAIRLPATPRVGHAGDGQVLGSVDGAALVTPLVAPPGREIVVAARHDTVRELLARAVATGLRVAVVCDEPARLGPLVAAVGSRRHLWLASPERPGACDLLVWWAATEPVDPGPATLLRVLHPGDVDPTDPRVVLALVENQDGTLEVRSAAGPRRLTRVSTAAERRVVAGLGLADSNDAGRPVVAPASGPQAAGDELPVA